MAGNVTSGPVSILLNKSLYLIVTVPPAGLINAARVALSLAVESPVIQFTGLGLVVVEAP